MSNNPTYEMEKASGVRRANGSLKLKKLKPKHLEMINLHLLGVSNHDIALSTQKSEISISRILNDPLTLTYLEQAYVSEQSRLKALAHKAVDAVDSALSDESTSMQLRGVDRFIKLRDNMGGDAKQDDTAEDIMKRILQVNIEINNS